jgi:hypothetical protein
MEWHHWRIRFYMWTFVFHGKLSYLLENSQRGMNKQKLMWSRSQATNECVKNAQMFHHNDVHLLDSSIPTNTYNNNCSAVDWAALSSNKGMRHVNIRENAVREAQKMLLEKLARWTKSVFIIFLDPAIRLISSPKSSSQIPRFETSEIWFYFTLPHFKMTKLLPWMGGVKFPNLKFENFLNLKLDFPRSHGVTLLSSFQNFNFKLKNFPTSHSAKALYFFILFHLSASKLRLVILVEPVSNKYKISLV